MRAVAEIVLPAFNLKYNLYTSDCNTLNVFNQQKFLEKTGEARRTKQ